MAVINELGTTQVNAPKMFSESQGEGVYQDEVRLVEAGAADKVVFRATPDVEESGMTLYVEVNEGRMPSSLLVYMGSPSRTFNISAKLISRTAEEAAENFKYKSILQAWRMPLTGLSGAGGAGLSSASSGGQQPGDAPRVIRLWGYGNLFLGIPTVVKSVNITYPSDVDYIGDGNGNMVPIVWPISVSLTEVHTIEDITTFDYNSYKSGDLTEWS